jgi:hypothetical protein
MSINLTKDSKGKWERIITKKTFNPQGVKPAEMATKYQEFLLTSMVTDEMLMKLAEQKSLEEIYGKNSYTLRDFEMALDGLQRFDEENGYAIFENEEFFEEVKSMMEWASTLEGKESHETDPEPEPEKKVEPKKLVVEPEKKAEYKGIDFKAKLKAMAEEAHVSEDVKQPEVAEQVEETKSEPTKTEPPKGAAAPKTVNIQEQLAMLKKKMEEGK